MQKFAAFDIDKTLYRGTLAHDFIEALIEGGVISQTQESAKSFLGLKSSGAPHAEQDLALVAALKQAQAGGKMDFGDYIGTGQEVARRAIESGELFRSTLRHLDEFRSQGRTLIAISTSPYAVVFPFCQSLGFNFVIAPMAQNIEGRVGPRSIIRADEKDKGIWLSELVEMLGLTYEDSFAIGDSMSDAPMLNLVSSAVTFNPDTEFLKLARDNGWEVRREE